MNNRSARQTALHRMSNAIKSVVLAALIVVLYADAIRSMTSKWSMDDYTHGYLIPIVVLYLLWNKRSVLAQSQSVSSWIGFLPIGFGIGLYWLGELGGEFFTLYMSLWFVIVGVVWAHLGWKKLKLIAFPLFLILTAFPFPSFIYNKISWQLKLVSSHLGVAIMQTIGMSAHREGNVIDLGFTQLQVVDACSGLRYLFPLIVLGLILAYFFKARFWKRALLVISTVPVSIITNGLRIALTGILYENWGSKLAEGFFHDFSGWFIFMFSLAILLVEMWVLNGFRIRKTEVGDQRADVSEGQRSEVGSRAGLLQPHFWVAAGLLAATLVLSQGVEFREKIPISKALDEFPMQVGEWTGTSEFMEKEIIDALDLSDYAMINYKNEVGRHVNFYVAYYESQRKGESIHTPETCLPGSGWLFKKAGRVDISLSNSDPHKMLPVNRALMQKGVQKQLVYFWFPQRGRILTNIYELKLYAFWDALTRQRTDGALVRLITPVYEMETPAQAEKRLQGFTRDVVPVLQGFLPS